MIKGLPPNPKILDIGCGPGVQTLDLAELTDGNIIAIDLHTKMIERTRKMVAEKGFENKVQVLQMDMKEMDFPSQEFDLIWSEGAIYVIGFRNGLEKIRPLVKKGGYVAVSEAVWLKPDPPKIAQIHWEEYPEIDTIDEKLSIINELNYEIVGHFVLPAEAWTKDYYDQLEIKITTLANQWEGISEAMEVIEEARREVEVFKKYHDYFSYCFFVMKKK